MGNAIFSSPCFRPINNPATTVKLISYGGATKILTGKHLAGEIMFEFPDSILCHADSFFIGHPIPSLSIDDELIVGQTYFLLPLDTFANTIVSPSSLSALASGSTINRGRSPVSFKDCPFVYLKGSDGRALIKVVPEFITRLITTNDHHHHDKQNISKEGCCNDNNNASTSFLCNTPELQKQYNQLVGSKDQNWSPKLETITEYKIRFSPCRFIGLEWKQKEVQG